jgi:hypothetical protein
MPDRTLGRVARILALSTMGLALAAFVVASLQPARRAENERRACHRLEELAAAQVAFRSADADGNGIKDYHTADVAGLYHLGVGSPPFPLRMIERDLAMADGRTAAAHEGHRSDPLDGYWTFAMLEHETEEGSWAPYGAAHPSRFGFVAVPDSYGRSGSIVFMIHEGRSTFRSHPRDDSFLSVRPSRGASSTDGRLETFWTRAPTSPGRPDPTGLQWGWGCD